MINVSKQLVFPVDSIALAVYNYLQTLGVSVTKFLLATIRAPVLFFRLTMR